MVISRRPRRRVGAIFAVLALMVIALVIVYLSRGDLEALIVAPAPAATPLSPSARVSAEELEFYEYVGPRFEELIAESNVLVAMGEQHSRDLVQLRVRSDRVTKLADEIDAYLAVHLAPERLQPAVDRYLQAVPMIRQGMSDAKAGVLRFNWDAVASGFSLFSQGVDRMVMANDLLKSSIALPATPASETVIRA
jgi:hypothetical protein